MRKLILKISSQKCLHRKLYVSPWTFFSWKFYDGVKKNYATSSIMGSWKLKIYKRYTSTFLVLYFRPRTRGGSRWCDGCAHAQQLWRSSLSVANWFNYKNRSLRWMWTNSIAHTSNWKETNCWRSTGSSQTVQQERARCPLGRGRGGKRWSRRRAWEAGGGGGRGGVWTGVTEASAAAAGR
jgi:hypothetical protein